MSEISKQALAVENTTNFPNNNTGYITPALLRSFNTDLIDSTVNQTVYTADSSSWNSKISQLNAFTASQQPTFTALNAFTASQLNINSGYNTFTQSADGRLDTLENDTANLEAFTSSINQIIVNGTSIGTSTRFFFNGFVSASIVPNIDGPIASITVLTDTTNASSASFNAYTASTNAWTASAQSSINELLSFSSSLDATFATDAQLAATASTLQASIDTKLNTSSFNEYTASITQLGFATTGSNTFVGKQIISGTQNGIALTGSESYIDLSGYNSHISMYTGTGSIRFYTGSADGNGTSNIDTWVNMQTNPANGALAISSFPANNHFVDFDVVQTASVFTAPLKGMTGNVRFISGVEITGSLLTNGGATFGNTTSQYNNLELKTSNTTYPGNLYNTIYINADNNGEYSAGVGVSTYTEFGSNPVAFLFGGGNGNKVDGGNTAIKLANGQIYLQKDTQLTGSLTITGSVSQNVFSASIVSSTASIDFSKANFFTLTLPATVETHILVQNTIAGQTGLLEITTAGTSATASFSSNVYQPNTSYYVPTSGSGNDILTFASFDSNKVYLTSVKNMTNN